jgi:hypothetical protein
MACYSILRIGPLDDDNAARLRSSIATHFKSTSNGDEDQITVSNRYFDAPVILKGLNESVVQTSSSSLIQEDGIILIFNSSKDAPTHQSFDSLSPIHEAAIQTNRSGELLRIVVGIAIGPSPLSDGSKKSEEEYSRRVLWCLDRGYEYVEVDVSEEGMTRGHDDRDKEGFARVVEAISSCMWSSHVMKPRVGNVAAASTVETTKAETSGVSENKSEQNDKIDSTSINIDDASREAAAVTTLMNGVNEIQPRDDSSSNDETTQTRQQEIAFHELEQVMSEAKRIREASQNDSMTDEERRQRAGDTAVRLMGLLEKLGLDEEEEEEDESDVDCAEPIP